MTGDPPPRRTNLFAVVFFVIALIGFAGALPISPTTTDKGRIISLREGWRGDISAEFVSSQTGFTARVPLPRRHDCKAGDTIRLKRWKRVLGTGYSPADMPPCARPLP